MPNLKRDKCKKYHIVYKTTNLKNGMIYIGAHSTDDLNDNYFGSGYRLKLAIKKYGIKFFAREILHTFDNPEEMFKKESELVNEEFIKRLDVYNIVSGGFGGYNNGTKNRKHMYNPETQKRCAVDVCAVEKLLLEGWTVKRILKNGKTTSTKDTIWIYNDSIKKMINPEKLQIYLDLGWKKGLPKSPTKGKVWIFNESLQKYSLCNKEDLFKMLSEGWIKKKWSTKTFIPKNTKLINNGEKMIKVPEIEVDSYIQKGWKIGKI